MPRLLVLLAALWMCLAPAHAASVRIAAPGDGATYSPGASVSVQSIARAIRDGEELVSHRLYHNGALIASANISTTTSHSLSKTLSGLASGTYQFASSTTNSAGQTFSSAVVTITVNATPAVTLTAPAAGASYTAPATVTLRANASDSDGSVAKVEFYNGSTLLATDISAPYGHTWSGVPGSASQYALHAKVYDNLGKSSTSTVHNITVNARPAVSISRSPSWSTMIAPAAVTLNANASDSDGSISKVEFYNGSTKLATDTAAPYAHGLTGLAPGSYSFRAKAYDNRGAVTISAANALTVLTRGSSPGVVARHYVYDPHHRLCKTIEPETGASIVEYDAVGNVAWTASGQPLLSTTECQRANVPLAQRITRQYDNRNRVRIVDFPDNRGNTTYDYEPDGLVKSLAVDDLTNLVTTTYTYNRRRLLASERMTWNNIGWQIGYGYNGNGHLAVQQYPTGLPISFSPNALGQPTQAGSYATGVSYYPNGAIKQFTYGNGIVHTLAQNERGLPERSRDVYGATAVHDDSVDYDFNGNVAAISDGLAGQVGNRTMTYDGLDRLTQVISPMFGGDNKAVFGYDAIDNLLYARVGDKSDVSNYYDDSNRLTNVRNGDGQTIVGLGYDARGNVANKNGDTFDFDYGNRLRSISGTASYVYDGLGRRVRDVSGASRYSLYSRGGQLVFTSDMRRTMYSDYVYLGGSLVATRERAYGTSTYTTQYHHTDALGSPVVVTDESRQVLERNRYAPYGAQIGGPVKDGPRYTGHVMDAASGLTYMQQRYYDPMLGRFLSIDPVTANSNTGGNFNRYWYANNNPYKFTDPDGRIAILAVPLAIEACAASIVCGAAAIATGAYVGKKIGDGINILRDHIQRADSIEGAQGKLSEGKSPAGGAEGKKGVLIGDGGRAQAENDFDGVDGDEIDTGKDGVRVKTLEGGGRVEIHDSTGKNPSVEKGTRTIKIQDKDGKVTRTIRYPEPK